MLKFFEIDINRFVNRGQVSSQKLLRKLNDINQKMLSLSNDEDESSKINPSFDQSHGEFSPCFFRGRPNYLLTQQIVGDIKTFIKVIMNMVFEYYSPVIKATELEDMREDIVESVTNIILSKDVYKIVFSFFRLEFSQLENNLKDRFKEFKHITPAECRVNEYFRLDKTSPLLKIYNDIIVK